MSQSGPSPQIPHASPRLAMAVVGLTVLLFGAVLALVTLWLRAELRGQIAGRDARVLTQVVAVLGLTSDTDPTADDELGATLATGEPVIEALVQSERLKELVSHMRGLLAVRLYDAHGKSVVALPPTRGEETLPAPDLEVLRRFEPISRWEGRLRRSALFPDEAMAPSEPEPTRPVLFATIPLRGSDRRTLIGSAQLLLDGQEIATEYAALDHHLAQQAGGVFLVGSLILVTGLGWTFRRLHLANRLLQDRTTRLLRANEELAMAARTSAVGAVTAHLIHGLKNPLTGLQQFVRERSGGGTAPADDLWTEALHSTGRMADLMREVTRVLQEERETIGYELSLAELVDLLVTRITPTAQAARVRVAVETRGEGTLTNRETNLLLLILENLLANAIEATPPDRAVRLAVDVNPPGWSFTVTDEGPGIAAELKPNLFKPVRSTKPQGTGIGLAISHQLAQHLGARLELIDGEHPGATFQLTLSRSEARPA